uniref:Neuromedin Ba n=1 Tax=Sparus aurata TaxID=8175 RepID=A0A671XRE9_SPAAU
NDESIGGVAGLLSSFIFISYIAVTSSMTLDLTELRNKISKIKVNPRGNLWATGHFMGKKSVVDSSFMEAVIPLNRMTEDLVALLTEILKTAQRKKALDMLVYHPHL